MHYDVKPGDLTPKQAERIEQLRTIRRNARKAARSGHPGKRAQANRALAAVPGMIAAIYQAAHAAAMKRAA